MRTSAALVAVLCLTEACGAGWQSSSYASGTTLVWLTYPAESEFAKGAVR